MKAVISSTYDNNYLFFIPIVTWCWNRLGVDVICFVPYSDYIGNEAINQIPAQIMRDSIVKYNLRCELHYFKATKNKQATYAQCSRLYAACLDLPEDEVLVSSDCDMANFKIPPHENNITIFGSDLVPNGQFPMCYATGTVKEWRESFGINWYHKTYQFMLDELLGNIECDHMRGNYWGKDQQTLWENTKDIAIKIPRARPNTQFASERVDRDDINWRHYLGDSLIDAHLWRPGHEENNFLNILELLKMKYPDDNFDWLISYREQYIKLL